MMCTRRLAAPALLAGPALLATLALSSCSEEKDKDRAGGDEHRERAGCSAPVRGAPTVELPFRVQAARSGSPAGDLLARTEAALCERLCDLGIDDVELRPRGADELVVRAPREQRQDVEQAAARGELHFYDWEPNVLGDRGPDDPFRGTKGLFRAVEVASRARPRAEPTDVPPGAGGGLSPAQADHRNDTSGDRYYLFGSDRRLIFGPAASRAELAALGADRPPAGSRVLKVPRGIAVVEGERAPNQSKEVGSFFVIEDDSELSGTDIENPEQKSDSQTQEPIVTMDFTDRGREAFAAVTKRIARRGAEVSLPPGASEEQREPSLQRFAITLDDEIVSLATIDHRENPEGIDGRTGAQINGLGSLEQTRRLVLLDAGPLPAELVPIPGP